MAETVAEAVKGGAVGGVVGGGAALAAQGMASALTPTIVSWTGTIVAGVGTMLGVGVISGGLYYCFIKDKAKIAFEHCYCEFYLKERIKSSMFFAANKILGNESPKRFFMPS